MTDTQKKSKEPKTFNLKCPPSVTNKAVPCNEDVTNKFYRLLEKLESDENSILCMRGDSQKTIEKHNNFITNLGDIFIVGNKSKSHLNVKIIEDNRSTKTLSSKKYLIEILKKKVKEINSIIQSYPSNYGITGSINEDIFSAFEDMEIEELYKWKIFLIYLTHNSGKNIEFNQETPVISVSYGEKKYETASRFAVSRNKQKKGVVYIYALDANSQYYLKTEKLNQKLKEYGVNWHMDIHNEIMLTNGMFPHFLLGVYEVSGKGVENLFINPWLIEQFRSNEEFDVKEGLKIDQTNFVDLAKKMGYKQFFVQYNGSNTFVTDVDYSEHQELITTST